MKGIIKVILILAFGVLCFVAGFSYSDFLVRKDKNTMQVEKKIFRRVLTGDTILLQRSDEIAKDCLEAIFWTDKDRIARYTGISYDPSTDPDYFDMIVQFHDSNVMKKEIYDAVGYDCGEAIVSILQDYEEWGKIMAERSPSRRVYFE